MMKLLYQSCKSTGVQPSRAVHDTYRLWKTSSWNRGAFLESPIFVPFPRFVHFVTRDAFPGRST